MPRVIPRAEAVAEVAAARAGGACLMCALTAGSLGELSPLTLVRGARSTVLLSRYSLRWGHLLVVFNEHVTRFVDLDEAAWREASDLAYRAARAVERALRPDRVFVASLGAASDAAPMTSPHLHIHVIPVSGPEDRPSAVLTWQDGVTVGDDAEQDALRAALLAALD